MFGSQVLEVAIGLAFLFFVVSLLSSAVVEIISQALQKRANELIATINAMIGTSAAEGVPSFEQTATYEGVKAGSRRKPSYISAKTFADGVVEILTRARAGATTAAELYERLPAGLQARLRPLLTQVSADLTGIRAEIERWFDETMDRLAGAYKRWSQLWLFLVGLVIAVLANASAYGVAARLWQDPVVRDAVVESAGQATAGGAPAAPTSLKKVAEDVEDLPELGLPVGWGDADSVGDIFSAIGGQPGGWLGTLAGWVVTALLVLLGAPFWFDLLTRLVSLRSAGPKPPKAADDLRSATTQAASGPVAVGALPAATGPEDKLFAALGG